MSISPYLKPSALNMMLNTSNRLSNWMYGDDAFDKRKAIRVDWDRDGSLSNDPSFLPAVVSTTTQLVDIAKDVMDTITNASGSRSPMYIIGEIYDSSSTADKPWYNISNQENFSNLVRAIGKFKNGVQQEGVIIDGLGDIDGTLEVDFTSNPVYFMNGETIDGRYRKPTKLRMTVMVSNYMTDDLAGDLARTVEEADPTGLTTVLANNLLYGGNTRAQYALYKLHWLMENAEPFTVHTPHGIYENMLIKRIRPQTDGSKMDMLYCDIEFQEMLFYVPYTNEPGTIPARQAIKAPDAWLRDKVSSWFDKSDAPAEPSAPAEGEAK